MYTVYWCASDFSANVVRRIQESETASQVIDDVYDSGTTVLHQLLISMQETLQSCSVV